MKSIRVLLAVVIALLLIICILVGLRVFREPADDKDPTESTEPKSASISIIEKHARSVALQEARVFYTEYIASLYASNKDTTGPFNLIVKANDRFITIIDSSMDSTVYDTYKEAQAVVNAHIAETSAGTVTSTAITWPAEADGVLLPTVTPTT